MYRLKKLPYKKDYITLDIYKYLSDANYTLGELKGLLEYSPYLDVLLKLLNIYEAINSSAIEGVFTNYETLFLQSVSSLKKDYNTQQVVNNLKAIEILYEDTILKNKILMKDLHHIQTLITPEDKGIRRLRGRKIYNKLTNEVLYVPPQNQNAIINYYENLIEYINHGDVRYDSLIVMAIIHYQFECIHPYKDGNGRVGRILNTISLIQSKRLNYPILNLSKYLNQTKEQYFQLLEKCHNDINHLDEFIIYILKGINETSKFSIVFTKQVTRAINNFKHNVKSKLPKIYSKELVIHLFKHPYTKNELLRTELNLSRTTATRYLKLLVENNFIESAKYGKETIYKNTHLLNLYIE